MLIIYGWKTWPKVIGQGSFHCPGCRTRSTYEHCRLVRFGTLFFIPILPLGTAGEFIRCRLCQGAYNQEVLELDGQDLEGYAQAEDDVELIPRIGSRIMAFRQGFWYPGTVRNRSQERYEVLFDDSSISKIAPLDIRALDLRPDDPVFVRKDQAQEFHPAVIRNIKGKAVTVQLDDGSSFATNLAMLRAVYEDE